MTVEIIPTPGPFGVEVVGITDAGDLSERTVFEAIAGALFHHRIARVSVPDLSTSGYARFGRLWGTPIEYFRARDRDPDHPELIRITNSPDTPARLRDGAMHWHQDSSYEQPPASVTMLHAIEAPDDNDTRFVDMVAAYEALDASVRDELDGVVVRHQPAGGHADLFFSGETRGRAASGELPPEITHPLVIRHPVTGRSALYGLSGTAAGIVGRPDDEAIPLLRSLKQHATSGRFEQRARAARGAILIWDNLAVMHCATPTTYSDRDGERRLLHRISIRCNGPLVAA